ncbi:aBC transporter ATP-binding protein [Firmicutes bacterium CAG:582]|nr:aBC transporter ATP-binding protein [Firmicutes bacterium CAG:582]
MKLIVDEVFKQFDSKKVLKGATFTFEEGKIYGLLGRNGAGKTTLFNIISKDVLLDSGNIYLLDGDRLELDEEDLGYVISTPNVPAFLTAREFLKFFLEINDDKIKNKKTIDEYFDIVGIDDIDRDKLLKDYSHGMKNKMQMLINFIVKPRVLLLDEPLTSLDVVVAEEMKSILKEMKEDSILILSTHIMELALSLCDEIVILTNGKLEIIDKCNKSDIELKEYIIQKLKDEQNYEE